MAVQLPQRDEYRTGPFKRTPARWVMWERFPHGD